MKTYFIEEQVANANHAGSKARQDIEKSLGEIGALPYNKTPTNKESVTDRLRACRMVRGFYNIQKLIFRKKHLVGQRVVLQYPFSYVGGRYVIRFLRAIKDKTKIVIVIHDLESVRYTGNALVQSELEVLSLADVLITHNEKMTSFLKSYSQLEAITMIPLGLFDYRFDLDNTYESKDKNSLVFAGNLGKSKFLEDIPPSLGYDLKLYGIGYHKRINNVRNEISYCGLYNPEVLVSNLDGGYGLVWDGDSMNMPEGPLAQYTKLNNPHKMSLYLAAGMPVICWKQAAIYDFVKQYHVGIGVDNLKDLDAVLASISFEDYRSMCTHAKSIAERLKIGYYFKEAMKKVSGVQ